MEFTAQTNTGQYDIEASVRWIGSDLLVAMWGGEKPHIGAVAIAQPRPSLKNPDQNSATASVFCFLGHKEGELAKRAAERLSAALNTNVIVTAGLHWKDLPSSGIQQVLKNSKALVEVIIGKLAQR
jgi:hypothetical protein